MISRIDFIHKSNIALGTVAASYTSVYDFEYPKITISDEVSYFAQAPSSTSFKLIYNSWIYDNVYSERNNENPEFSQYVIKLYDDNVLMFFGVIDLSQLVYNKDEEVFSFICMDFLVLITKVKDNVLNFKEIKVLLSTRPTENDLYALCSNNINCIKFILQESMLNYFDIEDYLYQTIPAPNGNKYNNISFSESQGGVYLTWWNNTSSGATLNYSILDVDTLTVVSSGSYSGVQNGYTPEENLNFLFFLDSAATYGFRSVMQKYAFDGTYYYKFVPNTTNNTNSGKVYKIPLTNSFINFDIEFNSIDAPYVTNLAIKNDAIYTDFSLLNTGGYNKIPVTGGYKNVAFNSNYIFNSKSAMYENVSKGYIVTDSRTIMLVQGGEYAGVDLDWENRTVIWRWRKIFKTSGTTVISEYEHIEFEDITGEDFTLQTILEHIFWLQAYNDDENYFQFVTAPTIIQNVELNQITDGFANAYQPSGSYRLYFLHKLTFTGYSYNNYIKYKNQEIKYSDCFNAITILNNSSYVSTSNNIILKSRNVLNPVRVDIIEDDIIELKLSRILPEIPNIDIFEPIEASNIAGVVADYYNNYFKTIKDKCSFTISSIFNTYNLSINTIISVLDRLYKINSIQKKYDNAYEIEAYQTPLYTYTVKLAAGGSINNYGIKLSVSDATIYDYEVKDI